ncbi:MAG: DUF4197 domain-containing protein [Crocinitomicaceae bacterium]
MKKISIIIGIFSLFLFTQCDVLEGVANEVVNTGGNGGTPAPSLTNEEVIQGLKEALTVGIRNGASKASVTDGFFKNPAIKLPFPPDAIALKDKAIEWGLQGKVDEIELTLNRAAEEASKKAAPIFVDAITNMSISDGFAILNGSDSAATMYLMDKTTLPLTNAFKPVVKDAIETVKLTSYWNPVATKYNNWAPLFGKEKVNADLDAYVTDRGISGLFFLVKEEEKKIRLNPAARVSDILKKVFGSIGK